MIDGGDEALDLLTVREVTARLRLLVPAIQRLIRSGELEPVKAGGARRVAPEAVIGCKARPRSAARDTKPAA